MSGSVYAKVRNLESTDGKPLKEAYASTPVVITGFKNLPEFGDEFRVVKTEKEAKNLAAATANTENRERRMDIGSNELIRLINRDRSLSELNIIIKADVQGSLTSVTDSLRALDTEEVAVRVVGSGVGPVNENDLLLAHSSQAIIYGFNVELPTSSRQQASRDKVQVRLFKVIYELIDDVKAELTMLLSPEIVETEMGRLVIKGVFKTTKTDIICGGEVTKGKLTYPALAKVVRDGKQIDEVQVVGLRRGQADAKEILEGEMCGVNLKTVKKVELLEGDRLELFTRETVKRQL